MTVTITLTISGSNTGPFDLHSDFDAFATPFESGVARASLIAGYTTALVPNGTNTIRIFSTGDCTNYIDVTIIPYTTTTSTTITSTSTSTTTSTTTIPPASYIYYVNSFGDECEAVGAIAYYGANLVTGNPETDIAEVGLFYGTPELTGLTLNNATNTTIGWSDVISDTSAKYNGDINNVGEIGAQTPCITTTTTTTTP